VRKKLFNSLRIVTSSLIVLIFLLATAGLSFAFRCGTSLVSEGATKHEVFKKCGEPDYTYFWVEERISKGYPSWREYEPKVPSDHRYRYPFLIKEYVTVDVWTYNLGPNRFIRYLTFENGILVNITTGARGY